MQLTHFQALIPMRVLSIKQPWATLIVRGIKRYEARSWQTPFRGQIALHASSGTAPRVFEDIDASDVLGSIVCSQGWGESADLKPLPRMAVVGVVDIVRIVPAAQLWDQLSPEDKVLLSSGDELPPGSFVWELANPVEIKPVAVLGQLNLWTLPEKVAAAVADALRRPSAPKAVSEKAIERARKVRTARIDEAAQKIERLRTSPVVLSEPMASVLGLKASIVGDVYAGLEAYVSTNGLFVGDTDELRVNEALSSLFSPKRVKVTFDELWSALCDSFVDSEDSTETEEPSESAHKGPPARRQKKVESSPEKKPAARKAAGKPTRASKPSAKFEEPVAYTKALAAIVGPGPLPRTEIMRRVWKYIKANRLQDPKDPRIIRVQKLLIEVIPKKKTVTLFEMTKHLFRNTK